MEQTDDTPDRHRSLETRSRFLAYVAELEAWLGRELFPPSAPTDQEAQDLAAALGLIRRPQASLTWSRVELVPGAAMPEGDGPWQFAFLQPLYADLFGERLYLGMEMSVFPEGCVEASGERLAIVPVGDVGRGTSTLHRPDEVPPEAAVPPASQPALPNGKPRAKVGRNAPCPCGGGKKYKHCHGR